MSETGAGNDNRGNILKNFIKDEDVNQENFIEFIENHFDEIRLCNIFRGEVIDFVIYHGNSWKLGGFYLILIFH